MRTALAAAAALLALGGCTAAYDDDGELFVAGELAPAATKAPDATPVVVDSDLAPDDLVALAYLLRSPRVDVVGITVPTTGLVTCPAGVDLVGDLFTALDAEPVPVACGRTPRGEQGVAFPALWSMGALSDSGLDRTVGPAPEPDRRTAVAFLADAATRRSGVHLVALGPLTEPAALLAERPEAYRRLAGVTTMAGVVDAPSQDPELGVGEWNAAADPDAFAAVLGGPVPVTVVPDDPVPSGPPAGLAAPVVGTIGVATEMPTPAFWDLTTAVVLTDPDVAPAATTGTWSVDVTGDRGRLTRTGPGDVRVVDEVDAARLDRALSAVFRPER